MKWSIQLPAGLQTHNELGKGGWKWRKYVLSLSLDVFCGAILLEQITEIK